MMKPTFLTTCVLAFSVSTALLCGCGESAKTTKEEPKPAADSDSKVGNFTPTILENGEPSHITVQHVLIAFKGSVPGDKVTRSKEEAEELAKEVLEKAKSGTSFDLLVSDHSDDAVPGVYNMANFFQQDDMRNVNAWKIVMPRKGMVPAFGDVGFPLKVGEIGMAGYDKEKSPYGWHIIKRVK